MTKTGEPIGTQQGETITVGPYLRSGTLADVYEVDAPDDNRYWVLKVMKSNSQADEQVLEDEFNVITAMRQQLPDEYIPILPHVRMAWLSNQKGLLLERMTSPTLSQYSLTQKQHLSALEWEQELWDIALQYAQFIRAMHGLGRTCNDRKLDDLYYHSQEQRLVVLDWNVIETISKSINGPIQDARLLARAWFGLLGGGDEGQFDMDSRRQSAFSVAGRAFLWRSLNKDLINHTYAADVGDTLVGMVQYVIDLFTMPLQQLRNGLDRLLQRRPLQDVVAQARDGAHLDLQLIPYWELADMLYRRTGDEHHQAQLIEIEGLRSELRQGITQSVVDNLQYSAIALKELVKLREQGTVRRQALVQNWQHSIQTILQTASQEGIELGDLREAVIQLHRAQAQFVDARSDLSEELKAFDTVETQLQLVIQSLNVNHGRETYNATLNVLTQVRIYRAYLAVQLQLVDGNPTGATLALEKLEQDLEYRLPDHLRAITEGLLPESIAALRTRLERIAPNMHGSAAMRILENLAQGNFTQATDIYETLRVSNYSNTMTELMLGHWLRPAYLMQHAQTTLAVNWGHTLVLVEELLTYRQQYPMIVEAIRAYCDQAYAVFEELTARPSPSHDLRAREIGIKLIEIDGLLNAIN